VVCRNIPAQSYALYLPTGYDRERRWPILYVFDPAARGRVGVQQFEAAAEQYGYIVVCSNNSRNGPREPILEAIIAMWQDTHLRFALDNSRIYTSGFSGGARVASFFSRVVRQPVTGIIACGAGLSTVLTPQQVKPTLYYGILGSGDFNYREMMQLDRQLDDLGTVHQLVVYIGPHAWPPQELCRRAFEWLEVWAMKGSLRARDDRLIEGLYQRELARAEELERQGRIYLAVRAYGYMISLFGDLLDVKALEGKRARLMESEAFKQFSRQEIKRNRQESRLLQKFIQVFGYLEGDNPLPQNLNKTFDALEIKTLERLARDEDVYNSGLGSRQLYNLAVQARQRGIEYLQGGQIRRAVIFYEIAVRTNNAAVYTPYDHYNLACAYARDKQTRKALKHLKLAVDAGFNNPSSLKTDPDLSNLRSHKEFQKILNRLE
jgi:tetratricopeptide (TPR) repeat protein